jgi:hypothetical protein
MGQAYWTARVPEFAEYVFELGTLVLEAQRNILGQVKNDNRRFFLKCVTSAASRECKGEKVTDLMMTIQYYRAHLFIAYIMYTSTIF